MYAELLLNCKLRASDVIRLEKVQYLALKPTLLLKHLRQIQSTENVVKLVALACLVSHSRTLVTVNVTKMNINITGLISCQHSFSSREVRRMRFSTFVQTVLLYYCLH